MESTLEANGYIHTDLEICSTVIHLMAFGMYKNLITVKSLTEWSGVMDEFEEYLFPLYIPKGQKKTEYKPRGISISEVIINLEKLTLDYSNYLSTSYTSRTARFRKSFGSLVNPHINSIEKARESQDILVLQNTINRLYKDLNISIKRNYAYIQICERLDHLKLFCHLTKENEFKYKYVCDTQNWKIFFQIEVDELLIELYNNLSTSKPIKLVESRTKQVKLFFQHPNRMCTDVRESLQCIRRIKKQNEMLRESLKCKYRSTARKIYNFLCVRLVSLGNFINVKMEIPNSSESVFRIRLENMSGPSVTLRYIFYRVDSWRQMSLSMKPDSQIDASKLRHIGRALADNVKKALEKLRLIKLKDLILPLKGCKGKTLDKMEVSIEVEKHKETMVSNILSEVRSLIYIDDPAVIMHFAVFWDVLTSLSIYLNYETVNAATGRLTAAIPENQVKPHDEIAEPQCNSEEEYEFQEMGNQFKKTESGLQTREGKVCHPALYCAEISDHFTMAGPIETR